MNWSLTSCVAHERVWSTELHHRLNHERIAAKNSLIESKLCAGIDAGTALFQNHVQNAEVLVTRVCEKLDQEIAFVEEDVDVIAVVFNQDAHSFDVRVLAREMERRG